MEILEFPEANLAKSRSQQKPAISLVIPTPVRQPRPMAGGDSPPGTPADSSTVRELLRKFDGGLSGEVFGSDRLLKLSVLGKGEKRIFGGGGVLIMCVRI